MYFGKHAKKSNKSKLTGQNKDLSEIDNSGSDSDTRSASNSSPTFYVVIGCIVVLLFIALLTWYCCRSKRKSKHKEEGKEEEKEKIKKRHPGFPPCTKMPDNRVKSQSTKKSKKKYDKSKQTKTKIIRRSTGKTARLKYRHSTHTRSNWQLTKEAIIKRNK